MCLYSKSVKLWDCGLHTIIEGISECLVHGISWPLTGEGLGEGTFLLAACSMTSLQMFLEPLSEAAVPNSNETTCFLCLLSKLIPVAYLLNKQTNKIVSFL